MGSIIEKYRNVWAEDPRQLLDEYSYQPELTRKLDALSSANFSRQDFYEIVLWKLNRFPLIDDALLGSLRDLSRLEPRQHRQAEPQLRALLQSPGIALPMASTVLRYIKPQVFQIIDDRVHRIVCAGKRKYPTKPIRISDAYLATSATIYFEYLDELHNQATEKLPFVEADRILYQLDIKLGNKIGD